MSLKKKSWLDLSLIADRLGVSGHTKKQLIAAIRKAREGKPLNDDGTAPGSIYPWH
jgi:hypothetical protein